ncbi:hypothetical protein [Nostoc sp. KVJ20]|uniref:hypothetical protein n=1 Tax=Nostoc sp. KVJ20 TaxID=457944 RepID=UPI000A06C965|nr:hypothetical protein [Nostoc sp. KVJ20]
MIKLKPQAPFLKVVFCDTVSSDLWGKVTVAVTRGKVACKYYGTTVSALMMIWDSDRSSLLKSSDLYWSRNFGAFFSTV